MDDEKKHNEEIKELEILEVNDEYLLAIDISDNKPAIEWNDKDLAIVIKQEIDSISSKGLSSITQTHSTSHEIKFDESRLVTPFHIKKEIKQAIEEISTTKLIHYSKSNWCSLVKWLKKKDIAIQGTCNNRNLKLVIRKQRFQKWKEKNVPAA